MSLFCPIKPQNSFSALIQQLYKICHNWWTSLLDGSGDHYPHFNLCLEQDDFKQEKSGLMLKKHKYFSQ